MFILSRLPRSAGETALVKQDWLERIERESGLPGLVSRLSQLTARDLQSLLLEVYTRRSSRVDPVHLLETYRNGRFTPPSKACPRKLNLVEARAFEMLPRGVEVVELSPVAPLGACSALAPVHQDKVLSANRNLEVTADPTNVLALECALRRQSGSSEVHLCANHRVLRTQALPKGPGYFAHFRILSLCSSFPWSSTSAAQVLTGHWTFLLGLLSALCPERSLTLVVTDLGQRLRLDALMEGLREHFPRVVMSFDPDRVSGRGYYQTCCFKILVDQAEIGDGGFTNWTRKLLNRRNETFLISGLGLERLTFLL